MRRVALSAAVIAVVGAGLVLWRGGPSRPFVLAADWTGPLTVTEIAAGAGSSAMVELYNGSGATLPLDGLVLDTGASDPWTIPDGLATVPRRGWLVLALDRDDDFGVLAPRFRAAAVLHGPARLAEPWREGYGRLELRPPPQRDDIEAVTVAWARPGKPGAAGSWPDHGYAAVVESSGVIDGTPGLGAGCSVGLRPGGRPDEPADWSPYDPEEVSIGAPNPPPRPKLFTPPDGTTMSSGTISVAWLALPGDLGYDVCWSRDDACDEVEWHPTGAIPYFEPPDPERVGEFFLWVRRRTRFGLSMLSAAHQFKGLRTDCDQRAKVMEVGERVERLQLPIPHLYQRKDSPLLCRKCDIPGWDRPRFAEPLVDMTSISMSSHLCGEREIAPWDSHEKNCARASAAMLVGYYGQCLSQDRIAIETEGIGAADPLAHNSDMKLNFSSQGLPAGGEISKMLLWALGASSVVDFRRPGRNDSFPVDLAAAFGNRVGFVERPPPFEIIKASIDAGMPMLFNRGETGSQHTSVIAGYCIEHAPLNLGIRRRLVKILDPKKLRITSEPFETWRASYVNGVWLAPSNAPAARADEPTIWQDSDCDGVSDYDELFRFQTLADCATTPPNIEPDGISICKSVLGPTPCASWVLPSCTPNTADSCPTPTPVPATGSPQSTWEWP